MSGDIPYVGFSFNGKQELIGIIGEKEYKFLSDMFIEAPFLRAPEHVDLLAKALNHFDKGSMFSLIEDAAQFSENFRAKYAAEEEKPYDQYNASVSDFSMPDLDQIAPPMVVDDQITFFVKHNGLGIPYRVTGASDGRSALVFEPL